MYLRTLLIKKIKVYITYILFIFQIIFWIKNASLGEVAGCSKVKTDAKILRVIYLK